VNVTKATLEGLFADELALLQPTPGYMRLLKESVLEIWKAAVRDEIAQAERAARVIKGKLDRLDEAFLFESGSNNCSFRTESRSTEIGLLEPAQPHRPSATCGHQDRD
jgi:hypothetical protein